MAQRREKLFNCTLSKMFYGIRQTEEDKKLTALYCTVKIQKHFTKTSLT